MSVPFDPGLQAERTALAWNRTALALTLAGAVVTRVTVERLGAIAVLLGLVAVAAAAATALLAGARYRRTTVSLRERGALSADGRVLAVAALSTVAAGVAGALFVVWGMLYA